VLFCSVKLLLEIWYYPNKFRHTYSAQFPLEHQAAIVIQ